MLAIKTNEMMEKYITPSCMAVRATVCHEILNVSVPGDEGFNVSDLVEEDFYKN